MYGIVSYSIAIPWLGRGHWQDDDGGSDVGFGWREVATGSAYEDEVCLVCCGGVHSGTANEEDPSPTAAVDVGTGIWVVLGWGGSVIYSNGKI